MTKTKYLVTFRHPSNFYRTSHYPRTADRFVITIVFFTEVEAIEFTEYLKNHNATDIKITMHY